MYKRQALADAREEHAAWLEQADVVVADVPCSGLGIIRKKPDIRYKNPRDLAQLPAIQGDILENACRYVCPGGVLVYSTCTVLPEENQEIIHVFLSRQDVYKRQGVPHLPTGVRCPGGGDHPEPTAAIGL